MQLLSRGLQYDGVKEARVRMYRRHMAGDSGHASCVINFLLLCNSSRKGAQHLFCLVSEGLNMAILLKSWQTDDQRGSQTHSLSASQSDSTKGSFTKRLLFQACVSFA